MGKKKPISVHLTDEERQAFEEAMRRDHMVDLGPWIAMVVRKHIAKEQQLTEKLDQIESVISDLQYMMSKGLVHQDDRHR